MSLVAKSLKRLKERGATPHNMGYAKSKKTLSFNLDKLRLIYIAAILFALILIAASASIAYNQIKPYLKRKTIWPPVSSLRLKLEEATKKVQSAVTSKMGLEELLVLKRYDEMYKLAKKRHNAKYEGIYYFEKGKLRMAYDLLNSYLKEHPSDKQAIAYIAYILYKQKRYSEALSFLKKVKPANCNIQVDKAIVYEANNSPEIALNLYKKAYSICASEALKAKLTRKMIVLTYYLKNRNQK